MIKRGDGSTGTIVESKGGNTSGVCTGCGKLFPLESLKRGNCPACVGDDPVEAQAVEAPDLEAESEDETKAESNPDE